MGGHEELLLSYKREATTIGNRTPHLRLLRLKQELELKVGVGVGVGGVDAVRTVLVEYVHT